ncbi:MAG: patatin-like phospholipase family protein [Bryobacteraceae bacterium]
MPASSDQEYSVQRDDAVCFTAGIHGVSFGAGTIHAYLASDRTPPKITAGISVGALTAAVMERCYRELHASRTETARWTWFRRYLSFLLDRPYDVAWHAIPNPSDFVADLPPVAETGLPTLPDGSPDPEWVLAEAKARRKLHIIARFGRWCSHLPVTLSSAGWIAVRYVRYEEKNQTAPAARWWNALALWTRILWFEWLVLFQIILRPQFFPEWQFRAGGKMISHFPLRPLFGWKLWLATLFLAAATIALWIANFWVVVEEIFQEKTTHVFHIGLLLGFTCAPVIPIFLRRWMGRTNNWGFKKILQHLGVRKSLIDDFFLRLKLFRLFEDKGATPLMQDLTFPVLMVAAPLQILDSSPSQLWPRTRSNVSVVDALRASLAIPRLFAPTVVTGESLDKWVHGQQKPVRLDLVDGSVVRHNPLPALVHFLSLPQNAEVAEILSKPECRVHLVYDIPILPKPMPPAAGDPTKDEPRLPTIVDTGFAENRLERRRDSRLEVVRTNFVTEIERVLREATGKVSSPDVNTITVDELAPEEELTLGNTLQPTETEMLTHIATGCRQSLSVLYREEIAEFGKGAPVDCGKLLRHIAPKRDWRVSDHYGMPGLSEVCRHCPRTLRASVKPVDTLLPANFHAASGDLARRFPELAGDRPRIVFLASGGVFRGSFHVGMIGAMHATGLKPDMIVGASVGTLLGAALGSMYSSSGQQAGVKLRRLANLFLEVDQRVALTKTLKAAFKDVGIRSRGASMKLSPNVLRKMVRAGSRQDPGSAITGAPPAVIDAISDLFLIPYRATARIAAEFVAGHFTRATNTFWTQIKTETIDRLGISDALIGSSLLERETRLVLGDVKQDVQPFLEHSRIAFFATAVNLVTEWITILGAQLTADRYDLIEALLASSAFPMAFAPRRASALYPGVGRRDVFYGDGGMFDNLPFLPAFEVLREVQMDRLQGTLGRGRWRDELVRRHREPDLFLVGALNIRQTEDEPDAYDSLRKIAARATSLEDNEKIYGMERASGQVDRQLGQLLAEALPGDAALPKEQERFLNGIVNAAVMPVYPADADHLNGTYEFCAATGMDRDKIRRSIADGCFQTMFGIARAQEEVPHSMISRSVATLTAAGRLPGIVIVKKQPGKSYGLCPFFKVGSKSIPCPFEGMHGIYRTCREDFVHIKAVG